MVSLVLSADEADVLHRFADLPLSDLDATRAIATDYVRERDRRKAINRIKASKDWQDTGALKLALIEMWVAERNELAERVVKDVKEQRRIRQMPKPPARTRVPVPQGSLR